MYIHKQRITPLSIKTLEDYVYNGGSFFALHSASASFKQVPRYFEILGGRFVKHGPVMKYKVRSPAKAGPAKVSYSLEDSTTGSLNFSDLTPFTVFDELYIHEYGNVNVRLTTENNEPILWTKLFGKGKICYLSLGHTAQSLKEEHVKEVIRRSAKWLLEGKRV
ncbi:MAG: ThuA domain-containing protein [Spirochaetales bacterium]|nr:ThuA domain-containing protein [Spirochaetales bacterium]